MPWTLEIHHLGVGQGDSTLILAKEWNPAGTAVVQTRSMLVDGGDAGSSAIVGPYVQARVPSLNVIVATHYDEDHFLGIVELLEHDPNHLCNGARLYDQGRAPNGTAYSSDDDSPNFDRYLTAIANHGNVTRHTSTVNSFYIVDLDDEREYRDPDPASITLPPGVTVGTVAPPWTLLDEEILWGGAVPPAGAPTVTCVAANKWVVAPNPQGRAFSSGVYRYFLDDDVMDEEDDSDSDSEYEYEDVATYMSRENADSNGKSLAFLLEFGRFRYYLGGDLTSVQEDELLAILNPTGDLAGRVHALKASHHGSSAATSQDFLDQLRPMAAFFSCGRANTFRHPTREVVGRLEATPSVQRYYVTELPYRTRAENARTRAGAVESGYRTPSALGHARPLPRMDCGQHVCGAHKCVAALETLPTRLTTTPGFKHIVLTVSADQALGTVLPVFSVSILRDVGGGTWHFTLQPGGGWHYTWHLPPPVTQTWHHV